MFTILVVVTFVLGWYGGREWERLFGAHVKEREFLFKERNLLNKKIDFLESELATLRRSNTLLRNAVEANAAQ